MTPEGKVKAAIKKYLDSIGAWYFSPSMTGYGRKGIPDIIGCYAGKFFAIEVKAPGKILDTTPWQEKELIDIQYAQGKAIVTDSLEDVRALFTRI